MTRRAVTFINSTMKWQTAGRPIRSDEEVDRIYNEHCGKCPLLVDLHCTHKDCGCNIVSPTQEKSGFVSRMLTWLSPGLFNKIRRATEHCPIGLW